MAWILYRVGQFFQRWPFAVLYVTLCTLILWFGVGGALKSPSTYRSERTVRITVRLDQSVKQQIEDWSRQHPGYTVKSVMQTAYDQDKEAFDYQKGRMNLDLGTLAPPTKSPRTLWAVIALVMAILAPFSFGIFIYFYGGACWWIPGLGILLEKLARKIAKVELPTNQPALD